MVRHRTVRTKGALSAKTAKLMVFKLVNAAAKTWRRLKGENQLPKVVQGVKFQNGIEVIELPANHAARSTPSPNLLHNSFGRALDQYSLQPRHDPFLSPGAGRPGRCLNLHLS